MSRASMQDPTFQGHQGGYMRQHPSPGGSGAGPRRPSRLLQMRDDYQRRLTREKEERVVKEKEEKMVSLYQEQQRRNGQRAERVAARGLHEDYPNSRLRQPGYMQQAALQQPPPHLGSTCTITTNNDNHPNSPSVRDYFRERHELEAQGSYVPPISRHFQDSRRSAASQRSGSGQGKHSTGVDRAHPLAPIQPRHAGVNSAPAREHPLRSRPRPLGFKQHTSSSPDIDAQGHVRPAQRPPPKKTSAPPSSSRRNPPGPSPNKATEKLSDFQKWQLEQNRAREERLKKVNMRSPPSERQSRDWGRDMEYEDEEEPEEENVEEEREEQIVEEEEEDGQSEELKRKERELLERIAQQQAELERLRREREEEEEMERQEAEEMKKRKAAERERRRREQQEENRRRRQEEADARRQEEEQQRAARARQERERFEARLDQYAESDPQDYYAAPSSQRDHQQPNSHRRGSSIYDRNDNHATPKYTPKPPSEAPTPGRGGGTKPRQGRQQPPQQRRPSVPAEQHDDIPVPGPGADLYAQAADEEQGVRVRTVPCKVCGRNFAEERIQKHQAACKNAHKKRQTFDPTQMRTEGTDMAQYIRRGTHKKEHPMKKKVDWRRQHQEFISNIRYAKQMTQMEQQGVALKDLPPPPPSMANPDLVTCPHCGRSFNEQAAERHIPRCQDLKTRPVLNSRRQR